MKHQTELSEILRKKGIGPSGSKSLKAEDLERLPFLMKEPSCSLTTKATLLTALLCLEATDEEATFVKKLKDSPSDFLPDELLPYIKIEAGTGFQKVVNRNITHEHLVFEEAKDTFESFFGQPAYLQGSFLEAQRLKRETFAENSAFLQVLQAQVKPVTIDIPVLIDFGDSYDGCKRFPPLNLFVAAILGSLGYPCLIHGTDKVAPKEGVTHHDILRQAGKEVKASVHEAATRLIDDEINWAYLDQSVYHPQLYSLKQVRKDMVKRPFLATFEKMLQPIRAQKNYLLTQYTHKHYKLEIAKLVAANMDYEKAFHIKGMEGTTMINPTKSSPCVLITSKGNEESEISGEEFGFEETLARNDNFTAYEALEMGMRVLKGEHFPARSFVQFQCVMILNQLFGIDKEKALYDVNQTIDTGCAKRRWDSY